MDKAISKLPAKAQDKKADTRQPSRIEDTITAHNQETAVDARALHAFLENKDGFAHWFKDRVEQYGFVQGIDYEEVLGNFPKNPQGGRPTKDYAITVDMAKELCMVERNAKGKEARMYFIEMEKRAKAMAAMVQVPKSLPEALRLAAEMAERAEQQEAKIRELAPKAVFHDQVNNSIESVSIADFAKAIGTGEIRFFAWLREKGYIFKEGRHQKPYQRWIEQGIFKMVEKAYTDSAGEDRTYFRILITGKGQTYLAERYRQPA